MQPQSLDTKGPGWPALSALVLLALALQALAWNAVEGYALSDSIEYLQLSGDLVEDGGLPAHAQVQRGPLYLLLLAPIALLLGSSSGSAEANQLLLAQVLHFALVPLALLTAVRLGWRFGGRACALSAGILVATNPVLLRFGRDPLPETAAGICLALAVERLTISTNRRSGLLAGLLAGLAGLFSYKTLPLVAGVLLALMLLERWHGRVRWLGCALSLSGMLACGVLLDAWVYGQAGLSLSNYLVYNVGFVLVSLLVHLGLPDLAGQLSGYFVGYYGLKPQAAPELVATRLAQRIEDQSSTLWYLQEAPQFLLWPALLLVPWALVRLVRERRAGPTIACFAVLLFGLVVSHKHAKSFRLWLPALPLLAALIGLGSNAGLALAARFGIGPRLSAAAFLLATTLFGWGAFSRSNPREHGHWWRALDWLEAQSAHSPRSLHYGADNWPVAFRSSRNLQLHPLPGTLAELGPDPQAGVKALVEPLDWLLVSSLVLAQVPAAKAVVAREFEVAAAFFEPGNSVVFGPILALRRSGPGGRRFAEVLPAEPERDAGTALAALALTTPAGDQRWLRLEALGLEPLPGDGLSWLTLDWSLDGPLPFPPKLSLEAQRDGQPLFAVRLELEAGPHPQGSGSDRRRTGILLWTPAKQIGSEPLQLAISVQTDGPPGDPDSPEPVRIEVETSLR